MGCENAINYGGGISFMCRKRHECNYCRKIWLRHWMGRLAAQSYTSDSIDFVTLTYEGGYDNPNAYVLKYSDVQLFFKRLRDKGFDFKYVVVGEHGEKKERAHWHALIYWKNEAPRLKRDKRINVGWWPHGYSQWERPRSKLGAGGYILKYIEKDSWRNQIKFSKGLGFEYLTEYARKVARAGKTLWPNGHCKYTVPTDVVQKGKKKGQLFEYFVERSSSVAAAMRDAYVDEWAKCRFDKLIPDSEIRDQLEEMTHNYEMYHPEVQSFLTKQFGMMTETKKPTFTVYSTDLPGFVLYEFHGDPPRYQVRRLDEKGDTVWATEIESDAKKDVIEGRIKYPKYLDRLRS